jgi:hypothetical protein
MPDGRSFLVEGADTIATVAARQLWEVSYPSGERRRITNDVSGYTGLSLSADATMLATVQSATQANIWIVPAGGGEAREIGAGPGRGMGANTLSWTTDGRVVFSAASAGVPQLWIEEAEGSGRRQLTVGERPSILPAVSPDDRFVYYTQVTFGPPEIWRVGIDGSDPRQLIKPGFRPVPSPDGRFVYFTRAGQRGRTMRMSVDGTDASPVSAGFSTTAISPDGSELMGVSLNMAKLRQECAILPTSGGAPRLLGDVPLAAGGLPQTCGFDSSGTAIVYVAIRDGIGNVFAQPLSGGLERPLTRFGRDAFPQIFWTAMSRDGRLAVSRGITTRDVVLISSMK